VFETIYRKRNDQHGSVQMNESSLRILVVGAGASGLSFALQCSFRGMVVRIVDKRPSRSMIEKATGVAAGVWSQLEKFGISPNSVATAIPMRNFAFYDDGVLVANVPVPEIDGETPAHLFPQGELELHLEKVLLSKGIAVEYGTEFVSFEETESEVDVRLKNTSKAEESVNSFDWLIGADGAHSKVREAAEMLLLGRSYPEQWSVAEVTTNQWPSAAQAQLYLQSNGEGLFLSQPKAGVVQGILNAENAAKRLRAQFKDAEVRYERHFKVALKRVSTPRKGRIWLIGDAAHVQSPVGGQGLNLAIWDGITLAEGLVAGNLNVESILAARAKRVLLFTDFDYRMLATKNRFIRYIRNQYWSHAAKHPGLARWFFKIISGVW
jgi:2-polyprenyl-6-methoxyphenol hydroxylase-like FAD-dependent oxidoreductase